MLQKHYLVLEKKEEYAKTTLIESQSKWTLFSKDILNIAKELLNTLNALQVNQSISKVPCRPFKRSLPAMRSFCSTTPMRFTVSTASTCSNQHSSNSTSSSLGRDTSPRSHSSTSSSRTIRKTALRRRLPRYSSSSKIDSNSQALSFNSRKKCSGI